MDRSPTQAVSSRKGKPKGRFYDPPAAIRAVPSLLRKEEGNTTVFIGSAEAVVAAGLLPMHLLPGQPGQPTNSVSLRPRGARTAKSVGKEPGFVKVYRLPDGRLRVVLNVDAEELARREAERSSRIRHAEEVGRSLLANLPQSLVSYCRDAIQTSGGRWAVEQWFNNPDWLASANVTHRARKQVLEALEVFELVDIEKRLATSEMADAMRVIYAAKNRRQEG